MKYVLYYRVSTKKQGDSGLSIEAQKAYLKHFISDSDVVCEFTETQSGKNMEDRHELISAIKLCVKNKYTLCVAKLDRLSRNVDDARWILDELDGRLMACDIPAMDKFTLTLYVTFGERERELASIRTKAALAEKKKYMKLGNPTMSDRKEEFDKYRRKGSLAMKINARNNENNMKSRVLIESMRKNGCTFADISTTLNDKGYKTSRQNNFTTDNVRAIYYKYIKNGEIESKAAC